MINVSFLEPWILSSMGQWLFQRISQWLIWLCRLLWRPPCWCWAGQQIFGRCYSRRYWGSRKVCPTVGGVRELQTAVCRESRLWLCASILQQESIYTSSSTGLCPPSADSDLLWRKHIRQNLERHQTDPWESAWSHRRHHGTFHGVFHSQRNWDYLFCNAVLLFLENIKKRSKEY